MSRSLVIRYYKVENKQSDILNRVFLILWINAFNSCETRLRMCPYRVVEYIDGNFSN